MVKSILILVLAMVILILVAPFVFIIQTIYTFSQGLKESMSKAVKDTANYFYIVAVDGLDQLGATILYKVRDLTISSNTFVLSKSGKLQWFEKLIDILFGKDHCKISAQNELKEIVAKSKVIEKAL